MSVGKKLMIMFILTILSLPSAHAAQGASVGSSMPSFSVESGDGSILTSDRAHGRVVVMFYESRDAVEVNRGLKNTLNRFARESGSALMSKVLILPVVDCSPANFISRPIWKGKLETNSKKEGRTIYGDWDGTMISSFGLAADQSNFLIIDPGGVIRYARSGQVPASEFEAIKKLLTEITR